MKRAKQVDKMVQQVNYYLKKNEIKNQWCDTVQVFMTSLMAADVYKGFNFYKKDGSLTTENECDYIQIY